MEKETKAPLQAITPEQEKGFLPAVKAGEKAARPVPTFKVSSHYVNQKTKEIENYEESTQLTLWDALQPATKEGGDIARFEPYRTEIVVQALRLTTREDNVINALMRLLKKKSKGGDYMGNLKPCVIRYGGEDRPAPSFECSLHEIATEVYGNDYSGRQIELIKETLEGLKEKRRLISYRRRNEAGTTKVIEEYIPLVKEYLVVDNVTDAELANNTYREKGKIALIINPLLIDQIEKIFIEYPEDIDQRTMIAAEAYNNRYPEAVNRLRDYLIRAIQANRKLKTTEINANNLPGKLGLERYVHEGRQKLIKQNTDKAFKAVRALGLVTKIDRIIGAEGQWKYVFHLNRDWQ